MNTPYRKRRFAGEMWSLRDMLERLEAEDLIRSISFLSASASRYQFIQMSLRSGMKFDPRFSVENDLHQPSQCAEVVERIAQRLGMNGVVRSAQHLKTRLNIYGEKSAPADVVELNFIVSAFEILLASFGNEMNGIKLFVMGGRFSSHFEANDAPFGEKVANSFPDCAYDIEESRKCLALERSTACGFHLMRAAEGAASILLRHLGGDPIDDKGEQRAFGGLVVKIGEAIEAMGRGDAKDRWMRLKGFLAACNRGFRTKIAHPGIVYTVEEAAKLFGLTESLLQECAELISTFPKSSPASAQR